MSEPETLLPPPEGPTPWDLALSLTSAEQRPLDADYIRRARIPWECPAHLLPWLAASLGVTLWFDDWSEYRKRLMCAQILKLRAQEGTLAGHKGFLSFVDGTILRAIRPPAKIFLTGGMTDEARERYLAGLPQIRIYPFDFLGNAGRRSFLHMGGIGLTPDGERAATRRAFLGHIFLRKSRGPVMYGRRATIQLAGGPETPVSVEALPDFNGAAVERLDLQGAPKSRAFLRKGYAFLGHTWLRKPRGEAMSLTLRLSDAELTAFTVIAGAKLQSLRPVRVWQKRTAPKGRFFLGRDHLGAKAPHLCASYGPRLVFDRVCLLDAEAQKATDTPLYRGRAFLGHCRFGIRPFHAELLIDVPMKRSRFRIGLGKRGFLRGYLRPADMEPLTRARAALGAAKALDDTLLLDTEVYRRVRVGDGRKVGDIKLGQYYRRY